MLPGPVGCGPLVVVELHAGSTGNLQAPFHIALKQAHLQIVPAIQMLSGGIEYRLAVSGGGQLA
ncbi:hypothetical protein D3C76_1493970 [compost metagenome]